MFPRLPGFKYYGTEYQVGMHVCSGVETDMPLFNRIDHITVRNDNAILLTCNVSTMYFDDHLNAFSIEQNTNVFKLICMDDLLYYRPYDAIF